MSTSTNTIEQKDDEWITVKSKLNQRMQRVIDNSNEKKHDENENRCEMLGDNKDEDDMELDKDEQIELRDNEISMTRKHCKREIDDELKECEALMN